MEWTAAGYTRLILSKLKSTGVYTKDSPLNRIAVVPILSEMLSQRDVDILGERTPVQWPKPWSSLSAAMRVVQRAIRGDNNFEDLLLLTVQDRDSQYELWLLEPGDSVVALHRLDPDGAAVERGTRGKVTERWGAHDELAGPLVTWPDGGICNVYPGDVKKAS